MENTRFARRGLLGWCLSASGLLLPHTALASDPLVVVLGKASKERDVSTSKLRRIFLNRPTSCEDGGQFIPLNHPVGLRARTHFDRMVLDLEPEEVQRYWIDQKIRGMRPPRTIPVEKIALVLQRVAGTIAYLPGSAAENLRALTIDGNSHDESGYLLR